MLWVGALRVGVVVGVILDYRVIKRQASVVCDVRIVEACRIAGHGDCPWLNASSFSRTLSVRLGRMNMIFGILVT